MLKMCIALKVNEDEPTGSPLAQHTRHSTTQGKGEQENPKIESVSVEQPGLGSARRKETEMTTAVDINLNLSV